MSLWKNIIRQSVSGAQQLLLNSIMSHQSVFILLPIGVFLYHSVFFPLFLFNGLKTVDEMLKWHWIFNCK